MKSKLFSAFKFFFGWPLSVLAVVFIGKSVVSRAPVILSQIHGLNIPLFIIGLISFLVYFYLRGVCWQKILVAYGHHLPFEEANFLWAKSEVRRYVPGSVWSFLSRAYLFEKKNVPRKDTAKGLILEAELIVLGAFIVSTLCFPFLWEKYFYGSLSPNWVVTFLSTSIFIGTGVYIFQQYFLTKISFLRKKPFSFIFPGFSPSTLGTLIMLSSVSFFFLGLGYFYIASSVFFIHPQMVLILSGFFVLSYLISYLSLITPSGLGVREGIIIFGLSRIMVPEVAGFIALFTRFILIIAEVVFLVTAYFLHSISFRWFVRLKQVVKQHPYELWLLIAILLYFIYFTYSSFLRYDNFYTGRFDLGNMAQTVWNTMHGRIFQLTDPNGTDTVSRLATHADFILILFAPIYTLWPNPKMLLLIQTAVLSLGALFVYKLAKQILKSPQFALTFALLYLSNPSLERSNLYDFHPVTLTTTFLLGAFFFLRNKRYGWFLLFALLAGLAKEQVWIIVGLMGGYMVVVQKKILEGSLLFIGGIALFYYFVTYAIPGALGSQHFALSYYSDFGDKPSSIIKNILFSPLKTLMIAFQPDRIDFLKQIFLPVGYYALFAPLFLLFASPDFVINLLSNNAQLHQIYYQYTATLTPFIFIASIYAVFYLIKRFPRITLQTHMGIIIVCGIFSAYIYGPLPGSMNPNIAMFINPVQNKQEVNQFLTSIPKQYSIAASNNVGSHLSQRQRIYTLPIGIDKADMIVLLPDSTTPQLSISQQDIVATLSADLHYRLLYQKDQFIAFKRKGIE
ncbi:hypothetical protein BH11PAT1_BH11PAT1_3430 [soil metagenome]